MSENAWGFTRKDLADNGVQLKLDVSFTWAASTPEELRLKLGQAAHVLHEIAQRVCFDQLRFDGLFPSERREILYGENEKGVTVMRDSGWKKP